MVQKVRGLAVKVTAWVQKTKNILESGKKLSMQDAKSLQESGEKLKVSTQELRTLRASLRAARGWANRVKRCNLEQGSIHVSNVKDLIEEYESFLIEMPEELAKLKQATQSYCVCRRPYDGFMIGCDECEEWYHGPCVGVSESRADRFDKYVCLRCSVKHVFKSSASGAVGIVRKWTSRKDLKKARQVEYQKHQRKVRKETKDAEKLRKQIVALEGKLAGSTVPEMSEVADGSERTEVTKVENPPMPVEVGAENVDKASETEATASATPSEGNASEGESEKAASTNCNKSEGKRRFCF
jgi:hypothetical protein